MVALLLLAALVILQPRALHLTGSQPRVDQPVVRPTDPLPAQPYANPGAVTYSPPVEIRVDPCPTGLLMGPLGCGSPIQPDPNAAPVMSCAPGYVAVLVDNVSTCLKRA